MTAKSSFCLLCRAKRRTFLFRLEAPEFHGLQRQVNFYGVFLDEVVLALFFRDERPELLDAGQRQANPGADRLHSLVDDSDVGTVVVNAEVLPMSTLPKKEEVN